MFNYRVPTEDELQHLKDSESKSPTNKGIFTSGASLDDLLLDGNFPIAENSSMSKNPLGEGNDTSNNGLSDVTSDNPSIYSSEKFIEHRMRANGGLEDSSVAKLHEKTDDKNGGVLDSETLTKLINKRKFKAIIFSAGFAGLTGLFCIKEVWLIALASFCLALGNIKLYKFWNKAPIEIEEYPKFIKTYKKDRASEMYLDFLGAFLVIAMMFLLIIK